MKILAVIPARAGSKGIPNKNIRLLNGKPMVGYAIGNALASRYVTDVVVTTDSAAVRTIARQMGAEVIDRSPELCGDEVTLDAVVYDAVRRHECDVVVTMQPTSPTLTVGVLDRAIGRFLDEGLDTLISAHNKPHLAWCVDAEGKTVPAYEKRLNRQYLPPYYEETGAFVISRRSVVSETSRIGGRIAVFDVEDSVDVDTFEDLAAVEMQLTKPKVAFYVNGNNRRGLGHVYRALELADEFLTKPDIYYDINQTDRSIFGETTHNLIPVNGIGELLQRLHAGDYTLFINDILNTSIDYMIAVRNELRHAHIVNFEDAGEGACKADLVFNALFSTADEPNVRAGEKYYISGRLFNFYRPITVRERVRDVFISFGGADPQNYSDRLLGIIAKEKYAKLNFHMVLGRAKLNADELVARGNAMPNVSVLKDIADMPEIMTKCDIGITSRGRTGYELAILGIPTISMAQNRREERHGFCCEENGFAYLGLNPSDAVIEGILDVYVNMPASDRLRYQKLLLSHDLKNGRRRVMNLIQAL